MHTFSPVDPVSTFVIRIWVEWSETCPFWRGSIEHLQSGNHVTFRELDDVGRFIQKWIGPISHEEETVKP